MQLISLATENFGFIGEMFLYCSVLCWQNSTNNFHFMEVKFRGFWIKLPIKQVKSLHAIINQFKNLICEILRTRVSTPTRYRSGLVLFSCNFSVRRSQFVPSRVYKNRAWTEVWRGIKSSHHLWILLCKTFLFFYFQGLLLLIEYVSYDGNEIIIKYEKNVFTKEGRLLEEPQLGWGLQKTFMGRVLHQNRWKGFFRG